MLWTLLSPLLQMLVYTLVFSRIMRIGVPQFPVFLLAGLLPWTLISVSATSSALSLLSNQSLIRKIAVPQAVYPLSIVGSKLVDMLVSLVPLALLRRCSAARRGPSWLLLLPAVALAAASLPGSSLLFSSMTVFFRDIRHLIDILFQIWFYVTPIIYPHEFLEKLGTRCCGRCLSLNPATPIIRWFQMVVYEGRAPDPARLRSRALSALAALVLGFAVFQRLEDEHIHYF